MGKIKDTVLDIEHIIKESGLKKEHIARQLGVDRSNIYTKRQNPDSWTVRDIGRIAVILNKPPSLIFEALFYQQQKKE